MIRRARGHDAQAGARRELFERAGATEFVSAVVMDADWSIPRACPSTSEDMTEMFARDRRDLRGARTPAGAALARADPRGDADDVNRVLDACDVNWCLDTGHLAIGGVDPVAFAKEAIDRVGHVHLKDVDSTWCRAC